MTNAIEPEAYQSSGSGRTTRAGTQRTQHALTAAPNHVKDFDPDELEDMIRKSKEEHESSTRRNEEDAEREYQEQLRYIKADAEAIKVLDARKAASKLREEQEREEADVKRVMEESVAAEAERQANAKAKLDALYTSFGKFSNDVPSSSGYTSSEPSRTPAAPPSRVLSSSAAGRAAPSSHAGQQPQRSLSVRPSQAPASSPIRRSATTGTAPASREHDSPFAAVTPRQLASPNATPTREKAGVSRPPTARQPASSRTASTPRQLERSPTTAASGQPIHPSPRRTRRAPVPTETIDEADEDDAVFLAALAASAASHAADQAQRATLAPARAAVSQLHDDEVNEEQFDADLQATLDASLGAAADDPDLMDTGLAHPPPAYTDYAQDKLMNHEKYTSAGGPDGSPASLNTRKEVRRIERVKKAQKAAEALAAEERRLARQAQGAREAAMDSGNPATTATPVAGPSSPRRPAAGATAGPSRASSSASAEDEEAEMMRPRVRRGVTPRQLEQPPPGLGSVAPGRRAPTPWNDAFASIAPRRRP